MKLANIILNEDNHSEKASSLQKEIDKHHKELNPSVRMAEYDQDRKDDDPLKGRGFGSVTFVIKQDISKDHFDSIKQIITNRGYEIKSSNSDFESDPGERDYYPKINFHFNLQES